jgi:hypothetical protein
MAGPSTNGIVEFSSSSKRSPQNLNPGLLALEKAREPGPIDSSSAAPPQGVGGMMGFRASNVSHKARTCSDSFGGVCLQKLNFLFDTVDAVKLMVERAAHQDPLLIESIAQHYKTPSPACWLPPSLGRDPAQACRGRIASFEESTSCAVVKDDMITWKKPST